MDGMEARRVGKGGGEWCTYEREREQRILTNAHAVAYANLVLSVSLACREERRKNKDRKKISRLFILLFFFLLLSFLSCFVLILTSAPQFVDRPWWFAAG